ncbi:MAG TPA: carboxypeptidase-like regulatory domain-containing protein [Gemmatimonadota bacterium]|nr:carboxypeptidase-like regulatory domain-containing protein [Gemmatimonadota bacterium]
MTSGWTRIALAAAAGALVAAACGEAPRDGREGGPAGPRPQAADTAPAPAASTEPVAVTGRVVEAGTDRGVPGAWIVVLEPGVDLAEWEASDGEEVEGMMAAAVVSDSAGRYRVAALPRGHDYTVMIAARGYRSAVFEGGLTIEADAPAVKEMTPVPLEPGVW